MMRAQTLDPLSITFNSNLALYLFFTRQFDQSVQQCRKTLEMEPNSFLSRFALGLSYEQQGLNTEAIAEFQKAQQLSPDNAATIAALGHALPRAGGAEDARKLLRQLEGAAKESYVPPYGIAIVHAGLGEKSQTLEWLERAFQDRSLRPVWLKLDPRLDSLRQDVKLNDLIRRVGLKP
jgi:tetratricopeptide (TPR) repeat protein